MQITLKPRTDITTLKTTCLVLPVRQGGSNPAARAFNKATSGLLDTLRQRGDFEGKNGQAMMLSLVPSLKAERVLLLGMGDAKALSDNEFEKWAGAAFKALHHHRVKEAHIALTDLAVERRDAHWCYKQLALRAVTSAYRYRKTLSKPKPPVALSRLHLEGDSKAAGREAIRQGIAIGNGMNIARELGNLPGNICTPSYLASEARSLGRKHKNLAVSVLDEKKMRELGMGALLSVSAGSDQPAKLIVMEYRGGKKGDKPQVLVGKGITFDTGGISIKPGAKMDEMKFDMCGAASVFGTLNTVIELQLPTNMVAIVAAAENMPGSRATKPGDVVTSLSGQTIEVLNTDAEGRMVLCDALTYAGRFKPAAVIDIATLTGACVVALGKHATGLYSNQDDFAAELISAGESMRDRAWQMPLWDDYQNQLDSNFADMANVGGPEGGSITAACFLSRYTRDYRWAHLDIAGTAWNSGGDKGATGRPVALLSQYLISRSGQA